jgi:hypothetical protein
MKEWIKQRLHEYGFDDVTPEMWVRAYKRKINEKYDNLLLKAETNKNYSFVLGNQVDKERIGEYNQCETNVFKYIKSCIEKGLGDQYYPVGGFEFVNESLHPVEHWWVYDKAENKHIDITPYKGEAGRCYAGIINTEIQGEIAKAQKFHDVRFFLGGNVYTAYFT